MIEPFSASKAGRHMICHGSANLEEAIPGFMVQDQGTGAAAFGTQVHEVLAYIYEVGGSLKNLRTLERELRLISERHKKKQLLKLANPAELEKVLPGVSTFTQDVLLQLIGIYHVTPSASTPFQVSHLAHLVRILKYVNNILYRLMTKHGEVLTATELTLVSEWTHGKQPTTLDLIFYGDDFMEIVDYKWGVVRVETVGNVQLMFYAATALRLSPNAQDVKVHVAQPRADNFEQVTLTVDDLAAFAKEATRHEAEILAGDLTLNPSDHCFFCPANPIGKGSKGKPACPAIKRMLGSRTDRGALNLE